MSKKVVKIKIKWYYIMSNGNKLLILKKQKHNYSDSLQASFHFVADSESTEFSSTQLYAYMNMLGMTDMYYRHGDATLLG